MSHAYSSEEKKKKIQFLKFIKLISNEIITSKDLKHELTAKVNHRGIIMIIANTYLAVCVRHSTSFTDINSF